MSPLRRHFQASLDFFFTCRETHVDKHSGLSVLDLRDEEVRRVLSVPHSSQNHHFRLFLKRDFRSEQLPHHDPKGKHIDLVRRLPFLEQLRGL